jgi:hypothetical protein
MIRSKASSPAFMQKAFVPNRTETPTSTLSADSYMEGNIQLQESPLIQKTTRNGLKAQNPSIAPQTSSTDPIWIHSDDEDLKASLTPLPCKRKRKASQHPLIQTPPNNFNTGSAISSLDTKSHIIPTRRRHSPRGISLHNIAKGFGQVESLDLTSVEQPIFQRRLPTRSRPVAAVNVIPEVIDLTSPIKEGFSTEAIGLPDRESPQSLCSRAKVTPTNNFRSVSAITVDSSSPFSDAFFYRGENPNSSALAFSSPLQDAANSPGSTEPRSPMTECSLYCGRSEQGSPKTRKPLQVTSVAWEHELQTLLEIRDGKLRHLHLLEEEIKAVKSAWDGQQAAGAI